MLLNEKRASKIMDKYGIDVLIATSPLHVTYATDSWILSQWTRPTQITAFAVLPKDEDPTVIQPGDYFGSAYVDRTKPWTKDIRFYGDLIPPPLVSTPETILNETDELVNKIARETKPEKDAISALIRVIKERGFEDKRIGIDELSLAYPVTESGTPSPYEKIKNGLPKAQFVPATSIWREIRVIKTPEEIKRLETTAKITLKAIKASLEIAKEGVTEKELEREFKVTGMKEGAEGTNFTLVLVGRHGAFLGQSTDIKLRQGDIIFFDCGFKYRYYCSDVGRTSVLGKPTEKQRRYLTIAASAQEKALQAVRPGVEACEIFNIMLKATKECPPVHEQVQRYGAAGHGIGLETYDRPLIGPKEKMRLEENMVLNVENAGFELGYGGQIIEDTVLVTKDDYEPLITHSEDFPFI